MTRDRRFASLDGRSRRWLAPEEDDIEPTLDSDFSTAIDPEQLHDGRSPMAPGCQPLARLGDLISIGTHRQ